MKKGFVMSAEALLSLTVALLALSALVVFEGAGRSRYGALRGGMMANDVAEALYASGSFEDGARMDENAAWLAENTGACIKIDEKTFGKCGGNGARGVGDGGGGEYSASRIIYSGGVWKRVAIRIIF